MTLKAFDDAKSTWRWADADIDNFQKACATFLDSHPYAVSYRMGTSRFEKVGILKILSQPTEDIRRHAYRILNDLRNSLDMATHAAAISVGSINPDKTNFPSGTNLADLQRRLRPTKGKNLYSGIPKQLHVTLESFQPFWRDEKEGKGNDLLRSLLEISNNNKHRIHLKTRLNPRDVGVYAIRNCDFTFFQKWISEDEVIFIKLTETGPNPEFKAIIKCYISFSNGRLVDYEAVTTFDQISRMVEGIINTLEAETERLIR